MIDIKKLKIIAVRSLKEMESVNLEPSLLIEILNEIEATRKDRDSYMDACNYEVNRSSGLVAAQQQLIEVTDEIESIFKEGESMKLLELVPLGKIIRLRRIVKALGE